MPGLWRNREDTKGGKYLVMRRDGSVPTWPLLVLGGRDPAAPAALKAYADECARLGFDPQYVRDVRELCVEFVRYARDHAQSDPTEPPPKDLVEDPHVVELMKGARGA